MWYYKRTDYALWTVGCDTAGGKWEPESDHGSPAEAAARINYLNGGKTTVNSEVISLLKEITELSSLSNMKVDENAMEKLTSIFMLSVKATVLLEL